MTTHVWVTIPAKTSPRVSSGAKVLSVDESESIILNEKWLFPTQTELKITDTHVRGKYIYTDFNVVVAAEQKLINNGTWTSMLSMQFPRHSQTMLVFWRSFLSMHVGSFGNLRVSLFSTIFALNNQEFH